MIHPVVTGDGSLTLYAPQPGEHYHSRFGAVTESRHIFIGAGLRALTFRKDPLHILEIGFGTGLNALLTVAESLQDGFQVVYEGLEPYPLEAGTWQVLNYPAAIGDPGLEDAFRRMHEAAMDKPVSITPSFSLVKRREEIRTAIFSPGRYDLVYFDPFSPDAQPEIWVPEVFGKLFEALNPGGILVTYCVKGAVTRGFKNAGFVVEKLAGPVGKRHIMRATKAN